MWLSNNRSAIRWRDGVTSTSLLSGLFVLLTLSTASCGGAESDDTVGTVAPALTPTLDPTSPIVAPTEKTEFSSYGMWILETLDGGPIIDGKSMRIELGEDQFKGYDGCNWITGFSEDGVQTPATFENGVLSLPHQFATTLQLCNEPPRVMEQAEAFSSALFAGETYRVADERLEIIDDVGDVRLVFVKQVTLPGRAVDLNGTTWRLVEEDAHSPGSSQAATVAFPDDRLVFGQTACRLYLATYNGSEGRMRFQLQSMLGRPKWQSCVDEDGTLEGEFMGTSEYAVQEAPGLMRLRIRNSEGETLTFEPLPPVVEDVADAEWVLIASTELRQHEFGMWLHRNEMAAEGAELTLSFRDDGIYGSTACNSYEAEAKVIEGAVTIDSETFFYSELWCDDLKAVMEQEERYLDVLQGVTRYGVYGDFLVLQTNDDVFLLFRTE